MTSELTTNLSRADFVFAGQNGQDANEGVGVATPSVVIFQNNTSAPEALQVLQDSEQRRSDELKAAIEDVKPPP